MILENIEQKSVITAAVISEDNPNLRSMFNREFLQIEKIANQVAEITGSNKQRYLSSLFTDTKAQIIFNLIISSIHKDINYTVASLSRSAQNDANLNCSFVSEMISFFMTDSIDPKSYNRDFFTKLKLDLIDACIVDCISQIRENNVQPEFSFIRKIERLRKDYQTSFDFKRHDISFIAESVENYIATAREATANGELIGIDYGYAELNRATMGIKSHELIIIAGRPGDGKSTALINILLSALGFNVTQSADNLIVRAPKNVLFFTIEMGANEIWERIISLLCHVDLQLVISGKIDTNDPKNVYGIRCKPLIEFIAKHLKIIDLSSENLDVRNVKDYYLTYAEDGFKADLIMVDYIQLLTFDDMSLKNPSARYHEIAQVSHYLKRMTKELSVPIVAAAQLNRDTDKTKDRNNENARKPRLSDLMGSSAIEQDANVIIGLWKKDIVLMKDGSISKSSDDKENKGLPIMYFCILKNRSGLLLDNQVIFDGATCMFQDASSMDLTYIEKKAENLNDKGKAFELY